MVEFKEPEVFAIEVLNEEGSVVGKLVKGGDWHFSTVSDLDDFIAPELRKIADKLDELNGANCGRHESKSERGEV